MLHGGSFGVMFLAIFALVFGFIIVALVRGVAQWGKNNRSPQLTVDATVVAKRADVSVAHHPMAGDVTGAHGYTHTSTTTYRVTFQVESGDRMEFHVPGDEYGMLVEGDAGRLTFQGTRYLGFERAY